MKKSNKTTEIENSKITMLNTIVESVSNKYVNNMDVNDVRKKRADIFSDGAGWMYEKIMTILNEQENPLIIDLIVNKLINENLPESIKSSQKNINIEINDKWFSGYVETKTFKYDEVPYINRIGNKTVTRTIEGRIFLKGKFTPQEASYFYKWFNIVLSSRASGKLIEYKKELKYNSYDNKEDGFLYGVWVTSITSLPIEDEDNSNEYLFELLYDYMDPISK